MVLSITPIPPTRAGSMACGALTNGWIAHRSAATKTAASGGCGATSTAIAEPARKRDRAEENDDEEFVRRSRRSSLGIHGPCNPCVRGKRLAAPRGHTDLRGHGAVDGADGSSGGHVVPGRARHVFARRDDADVCLDGRLPRGAMVEADREMEYRARRSEERRVGKECSSRWARSHYKKNT